VTLETLALWSLATAGDAEKQNKVATRLRVRFQQLEDDGPFHISRLEPIQAQAYLNNNSRSSIKV
jgi:hypothetical protein